MIMENAARATFVCALILTLALGNPTALSNAETPLNVTWLHTSGTQIYDENGQTMKLYGPNTEYGGGQGLAFNDIRTVKALGFNAFRLFLYWGLLQPNNESNIDESYFTNSKAPLKASVDEVVNWAIQENMYIILCLEWTEWRPPPKWAFPQTLNDTQSAALITGTAAKGRKGLVNTWSYIAKRYKDVPNVLFELLNEPSVNDKSLAGSSYKAFNEEIISAIESVETRPHLKIVEFLMDDKPWLDITSGAADVNKPNVVWASHHYYPMDSYDPNGSYYHESFSWGGLNFPAAWGNGTIAVVWRIVRVAALAQAWNKPWMCTEFGKTSTQANWQSWYSVVLATMEEYDITGWMAQCYTSDPTNNIGMNIKNPLTQAQKMNVLKPYFSFATLKVSRRS